MYNETNGNCIVSFSGGKDSTVLLALVKMCQDICTVGDIKAVFSDTGIEMGVTREFVKWCKDNWYSNIETIRPKVSFDWVIKTYGKPMKSKLKSELINRWQSGNIDDYVRDMLLKGTLRNGKYSSRIKLADQDLHILHKDFDIKVSNKCCDYLKKKPFEDYAKDNGIKGQIIGLRNAEHGIRELNAKRRVASGGKLCTYTKDGMIYKAPIIDWSNEDVETFIKEHDVPLSKAYTDYGFERTGCMACPYSFDVEQNLKYLHDYEQNRYKAIMHWLKDVYIAQRVELPFDEEYESERKEKWKTYEPMKQEMLKRYRPKSKFITIDYKPNIYIFKKGKK